MHIGGSTVGTIEIRQLKTNKVHAACSNSGLPFEHCGRLSHKLLSRETCRKRLDLVTSQVSCMSHKPFSRRGLRKGLQNRGFGVEVTGVGMSSRAFVQHILFKSTSRCRSFTVSNPPSSPNPSTLNPVPLI